MESSSQAPEVGLPDEQQSVVLSALRRAAGEPVSFSELRKAGVEFPASIVSELELAGIPIERCRGAGGHGAGVRLRPDAEATVAPPIAEPPIEPRIAKPPPAKSPPIKPPPARKSTACSATTSRGTPEDPTRPRATTVATRRSWATWASSWS